MNNETKSSKNKEAQEVQCTRVQQENTITHTSHWQVSIDLVSPLLLYNLSLKFLSFPSITSLPHTPLHLFPLIPHHSYSSSCYALAHHQGQVVGGWLLIANCSRVPSALVEIGLVAAVVVAQCLLRARHCFAVSRHCSRSSI
jgi:hypothetical protein